jgi:hypothetical protein
LELAIKNKVVYQGEVRNKTGDIFCICPKKGSGPTHTVGNIKEIPNFYSCEKVPGNESFCLLTIKKVCQLFANISPSMESKNIVMMI